MIDPLSPQGDGVSANAPDYRRIFLRRVHHLLRFAYERLTPANYATEEEPSITGDLEQAIQAICDDPKSPDWVSQYASSDDPPVNVPGRKGKHRPRIDIRIVSLERRPRTRFYFEAKRLGTDHRAANYWGKDGLGCYLRGDYASQEEDGGMLGYMQSDDEAHWASKLKEKLQKTNADYAPVANPLWHLHQFGPECLPAYRSEHMRQQPKLKIVIYHTLLMFH